MQTPTAPGAHPLPCAFQTACRMHLRTPSRVRSARPRPGSSVGTEYLRVHVLAAAALQNQLHLDVVLLPLLEVDDRRARARDCCRSSRPVIESTELGRSLPRRVASATASRICFFITI